MHSSHPERRSKPRSRVHFPVLISEQENHDKATGVTRDISQDGVYFYTESPLVTGQVVEFKMLMPLPGGTTARAFCNGTVLRIESANRAAVQAHGVAVHMISVKLV